MGPQFLKEECRVIRTEELYEWFSEETGAQNPQVLRSEQLGAETGFLRRESWETGSWVEEESGIHID